MRSTTFIGRERELSLLDSLGESKQAEFLITYGRRRIGKTRLLTHWLTQRPGRGLYWVATPSSATEQLREFSKAIYGQLNQNSNEAVPDNFTYANWRQALLQAVELCKKDRFVLIIDEFTYLLQNTPELAGILQNLWDHQLSNTNLFLILCGSHIGMMQKHLLAYQAPLYGRASAQLHLQPLPFGVTAQYFPNYSAQERVAVYALFGGVPAYWEFFEQKRSISHNIRYQLLTPNHLMQYEPRLLLHDFIQKPDNYIALLRAIANGYRTQKEMITFSGLTNGHVAKYLSVLIDTGFVKRHVPVFAGPRSRKSRYHIVDPYLRFYYRFLAQRQSQLALGVHEAALAEIQKHLISFIGTHTWEELCREWVLRAGAANKLPFMSDQVGSYWDKNVQIDIVGVNQMEKTLYVGECKWSPKQMGVAVLTTLASKTNALVPNTGQWSVHYLGFARGGWSSTALDWCNTTAPTLKGDNWHCVGASCYDLADVDTDLTIWRPKN